MECLDNTNCDRSDERFIINKLHNSKLMIEMEVKSSGSYAKGIGESAVLTEMLKRFKDHEKSIYPPGDSHRL